MVSEVQRCIINSGLKFRGGSNIVKTIAFFIPVTPQAKQSVRIGRNRYTGRVMAFPDHAKEAYQNGIAAAASIHRPPACYMDKAIRMTLLFYFQKPKSAKRIYHTVRPDTDNLEKPCKDAFNGIMYNDDSQCFDVHVIKHYVTDGKEGIAISIDYL